MSSATKKIRRLLNERLAEYEVDDAKTVMVTRWRAYGDWVSFIEYDNGDTKFCIDARRLTPEQAIAATLGPRTYRKLPKSGGERKSNAIPFGDWLDEQGDDVRLAMCDGHPETLILVDTTNMGVYKYVAAESQDDVREATSWFLRKRMRELGVGE